MKTRTLYNALPIVAAAYGRKFGVEVQVGGDTAYTNGQVINIPNVSDDFLEQKDVIWGYLAHEAAHVRFTTFLDRPQNLYGDLLNILEDTRIEREMVRVYPGTFNTLYAVAEYMAKMGHYVLLTPKSPPAQIVAGYCLYYLQVRYMEQTVLEPFLDASKVALQHILPQPTISDLDDILDSVPNTKSTIEASELAQAIIDLLKQLADNPQQATQGATPPNQDQGDDDQDQEETQGLGSNQGQNDGDSDQDNMQGDDGQAQGSTQDSVSSQAQGKDSQGQESSCGSSQDYVSAIKAALTATDEQTLGDLKDKLKEELSLSSSKVEPYKRILDALDSPPFPLIEEDLLSQVMSDSNRIRQQLYGLVQAKNHTAKRSERRGKHLDKTRISRIVSGDFRVFSRSSERIKPNTAVHLLVDLSHSMNYPIMNGESPADVARKSSLALAIALESIHGVNVAVTYFCGTSSSASGVKVFSVVKHGEKVKPKAKLFNMPAGGSTPLAESLWYVGSQIIQTKNDRKIILVLTDGEPDHVENAHDAIGLCKNSGIEMIGIGIRTPIINRFFENHININDVNEMRSTLFSIMENALTAA